MTELATPIIHRESRGYLTIQWPDGPRPDTVLVSSELLVEIVERHNHHIRVDRRNRRRIADDIVLYRDTHFNPADLGWVSTAHDELSEVADMMGPSQ